MAISQIKKHKIIKDENGNKIQVQKTKEEWNRETKNGTATWFFIDRYKINDKIKQYHSGVFTYKRNAEEEEIIFKSNPIEYINKHSKKAKIEDCNIDSKNNKILDDYYESFFEYDKTINKESTAYDHKKNYYKHISPILGDNKPSDLNISTVDNFHEEILKKGLSHSTNINIHSVLSKFLEFLKIKGVIDINYAKVHGTFKHKIDEETCEEKQIKYQTEEEFNCFMSYIEDNYWYAFFNFLFWHGLRKGEQQALRWSDINFDDKTIRIHNSISKSATGGVKISSTKRQKDRTISIADKSYNVLKMHYEYMKNFDGFDNSWFVFGYGSTINDIIARNTIDRYIKKIYIEISKKNKNINILTHHEFGRHSHASYLLNKGIEKGMPREVIYEIIAERLGDTVEVIKNTYAHAYETKYYEQTRLLLNI